MTLETEGYSAKFGDRTAGALDISTRHGSSTETDVRMNVSAIDASATAEGPLARPLLEARLIPGGIMPDNYQAPILNALRGYAKGVEIFLQRRSANRLNGWAPTSSATRATGIRRRALGFSRIRTSAIL